MHQQARPPISPLIVQLLIEAGFTQDEIKQKMEELNIKINAAIIESVFIELTPDEQEKLEKKLNQIDQSDVYQVTQALRAAGGASFNKIDVDKLADRVRVKMMEKFWQEISPVLTDTQRSQLANNLKNELEHNPDFAKVAAYYVALQQEKVGRW